MVEETTSGVPGKRGSTLSSVTTPDPLRGDRVVGRPYLVLRWKNKNDTYISEGLQFLILKNSFVSEI